MKNLLHVGCGHNTKKNTLKYYDDKWKETRVDINPDVKPDILGSITDLSNVKSNFYDSIFSSHNIEHVYIHEVNTVLTEFYKVLNQGGFLVITCPDIKSICKLVVEDKLLETAYESPAGSINPADMLWGHSKSIKEGNKYMTHKCGFTKKTLMIALTNAGFKSVAGIEIPEHFELWAIAHKNKIEKEFFAEHIKKILSEFGKVIV